MGLYWLLAMEFRKASLGFGISYHFPAVEFWFAVEVKADAQYSISIVLLLWRPKDLGRTSKTIRDVVLVNVSLKLGKRDSPVNKKCNAHVVI